ncbi:MAG TPA: hypothetical protein ENN38_02300 [Actinobacteria bacterium]|nr:hypothetical protein [Actinomycetota bacterium]
MVDDEIKQPSEMDGERGKEEEEEEKSKKKFNLKLPRLKLGKFKVPILIILVVGLAVGTAFGVMKFMGKSSAPENEKKEEVELDVGAMVSMGSFTVNLAGSDSYLQLEVSIELEKDNKPLKDEVKTRKTQIKDAMLTILRSKTPDQVRTAEGEEQLKKEIKNGVDSLLTCGKIKGVYFTTFIMQ